MKDNKFTCYWEQCGSIETGITYAYTAPELGVMANEKTIKESIDTAIEMLKYTKQEYDKNGYREQDKTEAEYVNKAFEMYVNNEREFRSRLKLNEGDARNYIKRGIKNE